MQLIDDAGRLWHRLWSVRLSLLAAALGALDAAMPYLAPAQASRRFAAATALVALAAGISRLIAQPKTREAADGDR